MSRLADVLVQKHNYTNKDISLLKNTSIREYDIQSAGFNVIKFKKLLPPEEILKIDKMPKGERNIYIGLRIRDIPSIATEINNTLIEVRQEFVRQNALMEEDILTIKKDAIFLIGKVPTVLEIYGFFKFVLKGRYTSYMLIGNKELYYSSIKDMFTIKGISDENLEKCLFVNDLKSIMGMMEKLPDDQMFNYLKRYRAKYVAKELPLETYRNLESGKFSMGDYLLDNGDGMLEYIDISQNYINFLLPMIRLII